MTTNNSESAADLSETVKYQQMLTEVEKLVAELSRDDADLDEIVAKVERGYGLIRVMRQRLEDTKLKLEQLQEAVVEGDSTS